MNKGHWLCLPSKFFQCERCRIRTRDHCLSTWQSGSGAQPTSTTSSFLVLQIFLMHCKKLPFKHDVNHNTRQLMFPSTTALYTTPTSPNLKLTRAAPAWAWTRGLAVSSIRWSRPGTTRAWNFFSNTGAKSVDIWPMALQHAYRTLHFHKMINFEWSFYRLSNWWDKWRTQDSLQERAHGLTLIPNFDRDDRWSSTETTKSFSPIKIATI